MDEINDNKGDFLDEDIDPRVESRLMLLLKRRLPKEEREEVLGAMMENMIAKSEPYESFFNIISRISALGFNNTQLNIGEFVKIFRKKRLARSIAERFVLTVDSRVREMNVPIDLDRNGEYGLTEEIDPSVGDIKKNVNESFEDWIERLNDEGTEDANGEAVIDDYGENDMDERTLLRIREQLASFVKDNRLTTNITLFKKCEDYWKRYPSLKLFPLFIEEFDDVDRETGETRRTSLLSIIEEKINQNVEEVAKDAYKELFLQDRRGFVMSYIMGRVIRPDEETGKMVFNRQKFWDLMTYLSDLNEDVQNGREKVKCSISNPDDEHSLYDWLYYDSKEMSKLYRQVEVDKVRGQQRFQLWKAGLEVERKGEGTNDDLVFFEDGFDVSDFYKKYIMPEILRFNTERIGRKGGERDLDWIMYMRDPKNVGRSNFSLQMLKSLRGSVLTFKNNPDLFFEDLRSKLQLPQSMSNHDVMDHCSYFLRGASLMIKRTIREATAFRKDEAVKDRFVYPEEVLKCDDLVQLMEWFVTPDKYLKKYPDAKFTAEQIRHSIGVMLLDFMEIREDLSKKEIIESEITRARLEAQMKRYLNIEVLAKLEVAYRVIEECYEDGSPVLTEVGKDSRRRPINKRNYQAIVDPEGIEAFVNGQDPALLKKVLSAEKKEIIKVGDKYFRVLRLEIKKFTKIKMKLPRYSYGRKGEIIGKEFVEVEALVYTGDDHLMHLKDQITREMSRIRGKEITDDFRWMISFSSVEDYRLFKDFMYNYIGFFEPLKVEDGEEGRDYNTKTTASRKTSTKCSTTRHFKKDVQDSKFTGIRRLGSVKSSDGKLEVTEAVLETQCSKLMAVLLAVSDDTVFGHDKYKAARAWAAIARYFDPAIWGDVYKEIIDRGFDYLFDEKE